MRQFPTSFFWSIIWVKLKDNVWVDVKVLIIFFSISAKAELENNPIIETNVCITNNFFNKNKPIKFLFYQHDLLDLRCLLFPSFL